jgi:hypothetical protein
VLCRCRTVQARDGAGAGRCRRGTVQARDSDGAGRCRRGTVAPGHGADDLRDVGALRLARASPTRALTDYEHSQPRAWRGGSHSRATRRGEAPALRVGVGRRLAIGRALERETPLAVL